MFFSPLIQINIFNNQPIAPEEKNDYICECEKPYFYYVY